MEKAEYVFSWKSFSLDDKVVVPYNLCVFLVLAFAVPPLAKHDRGIHVCRRKGVGFIQQWDHAQQDCSTDKHTRYSTVQRFGVGKISEMIVKEVSHAHQGGIYMIKNTVKTVILWKIITI